MNPNNVPCTNKQMLDWEKEAQTILNQQTLVARLLKTEQKTNRWLGVNAIRLQAIKDRMDQIGKKYFQCDLHGVLKEEIKDHQIVNLIVDGMKMEDYGKEMHEYLNQQTTCTFE